MILPVIMAGGSGTRLWPLSRQQYPKQFLPLMGEFSMLQETVTRLNGLAIQPPMVICNEDYRFIVAEQLRSIGQLQSSIILEPAGRNTAPAIALAALKALKDGSDPLLLVLAADHNIKDTQEFCRVVESARAVAEQGKMVTFGIVPTAPETGYGYIRRGKPVLGHNTQSYGVREFVEKPNSGTAKRYISSGEFYWNSGLFLFKASSYLEALKKYRPDIYIACKNAMAVERVDLDFVRVNESEFLQCPSESIDYAIMEPLCKEANADQVEVFPLSVGWSDVGGFAALWDVKEKDIYGNAVQGDVKILDTNNCLILTDDKLVTTVGVNNLVIVNTKDAVLVSSIDKVQEVKGIVNLLKEQDRKEVNYNREEYRPWGSCDSIDSGVHYQVKRVIVKLGAKLSVQVHQHRAEHWIIVSGTAKAVIDGKVQILNQNQSTYIPAGIVHSLENTGTVALELIEVQSGDYLSEDDIVRFEDLYEH